MRKHVLWLSVCAALANTAQADTETSSKIETITVLGQSNISEAEIAGIEIKALPINTHVVGRAEIDRIMFVDPDELLDRIPGETQVRNLRIADGGKSYTIPMLDGVPLENPYEGATQRLDRVNTSDIERVEIIKGPASALFGNNAFGGVVNVVSRKPPEDFTGNVSLEAGNFNRLRTNVGVGGSSDDLGFLFNVNTRNIDGLREGTVDDREQASGKLVFYISEDTQVTARAEYLDFTFVQRGDLTAEQIAEDKRQAGGLSSSTDTEQTYVSVQLEHTYSHGEISASLVRREKDTIGLSRFRGPQDENDLGYSAKVLLTRDFDSGKLALGAEHYDGVQDTKQYGRSDIELTGDFSAFENELEVSAYFGQYILQASDKLSLSLGARHEKIELYSTIYDQGTSFSDTAPKLGATYQLNDDHMVWLGVSDGFYAPDAGDLFDLDEGNPDLAPEQAQNIELGLRGQFGDISYDTSYYDMNIDDFLVTQEFVRIDPNDPSQEIEFERTTNAGEVSIRGLETVLEYAPKGANWRLGLTHTFNRSEYISFVQSTPGAADDLSGKQLRRTPKHHLNVRAAWLPSEDLSLELEVDMYSSYYADHANSPEGEFTRDERVNLRLDYHLADWRIWLTGLNLTDTLEDRATFSRGRMKFRTANGRSYYIGASYQF